jgi:hypothetical protein
VFRCFDVFNHQLDIAIRSCTNATLGACMSIPMIDLFLDADRSASQTLAESHSMCMERESWEALAS